MDGARSGSSAVPVGRVVTMNTGNDPRGLSGENGGQAAMVRLVETFQPKNYEIKLVVDPNKDNFSGRVKIQGDLPQATSKIQLHSVGLSFQKISVNGESIGSDKIELDETAEIITIPLESSLTGAVEVELEYSAPYNMQLKGLYLSTAKHKDQTERYAFTQFEATDFRRMVPSIDEPEAKAVFSLTVAAPKHLTVISNMKAVREAAEGQYKAVTFDRSPKMSTYLLALGVARLGKKTVKEGKTEINIYTLPQDQDKADFALKTAVWSLKFLNNYFKFNYPLAKLDLVAVPDFASGAMENFGMMTFRDTAILIHPGRASIRDIMRVAEVVAHEIVHQWFGDLVTMNWWNDLWLNEAFATWLSYKVVDGWYPEWRVWDEFDEGKRAALRTDSLDNTRSVAFDVRTSPQIREMFDVLTYQKGGSVLRMIETHLTPDVFCNGLRIYMRKHQYNNAAAGDLWSALEEAARKAKAPVGEIANSWISQPGYPILRVELLPDGRTLRLMQSRFFADGRQDDSSLWAVPVIIKYQIKGDKKVQYKRVLMRGREMEVKISEKRPIEWLYPNSGEIGFYRVSLDSKLLGHLKRVAAAKLTPVERAGLLDHLWWQTRNGQIPTIGPFLEMVESFNKEESRLVLEGMAGCLRVVADRLLREEDRPAFAEYAKKIFSYPMKQFGWGPKSRESDDKKLARAAVIDAMGSLVRPADLFVQVEDRVKGYLADPKSIEPTLVSVVLSLAARNNPADAARASERFGVYKQKLMTAEIPQDKQRYYRAMAEFPQPSLTDKLLAMSLEKIAGEDAIRSQDAWIPLTYLLGNPVTQARAWEFIKANWGAIYKKMGDGLSGRIIAATGALWRTSWIEQAREFYKDAKYAERTLAQAVEAATLGSRFVEKQTGPLSEWLHQRDRRNNMGLRSYY